MTLSSSTFFAAILGLVVVVGCVSNTAVAGWKGRANLPPASGKTGPEAVLILIQGAQVPGLQYASLLAQIQNTSSLKLWASSSDFVGDLPNPVGIAYEVAQSLSELKKNFGMPDELPVFVAGHSLGGVIVQDWVAAQKGMINGKPRVKATLLLGAFLQRKYNITTFPTPVLQLAGTLDGLTRTTRIMESYYRANLNVTDDFAALNPVIAVEGMSHAQFFDGKPPHLVKTRDLKPDIDVAQARQAVSEAVANYLEQLTTPAPGNVANVKKTLALVKKTGEFFAPLLNAFYQEGYAFFRMPCNLVNDAPGCMPGCPWTEYMQKVLAADVAPGFELHDVDSFHRVYHLPDVKLPEIVNNCSQPTNCKLLTRTVTQGGVLCTDVGIRYRFFPSECRRDSR